MQLNEILEENSIKAVSQKTKIPEENLQDLLNADFDTLKKIKTLGFISILEREYQADLSALREKAMEYYRQNEEDSRFSVHVPLEEGRKKRSKLFKLLALSILAYASWYFFTQFDQRHLSQLIPFMGDQTIEDVTPSESDTEKKQEDIAAELSIENLVIDETKMDPVIEKAIEVVEVQRDAETAKTVEVEDVQGDTETAKTVEAEVQTVSIVPVGQLWFGVIELQTKKREHFTISQAYELDVETKSWLLATSAAPFSLVQAEETRDFNDAQEHYFKIDKNGIQSLTRDEYISLGGWNQW